MLVLVRSLRFGCGFVERALGADVGRGAGKDRGHYEETTILAAAFLEQGRRHTTVLQMNDADLKNDDEDRNLRTQDAMLPDVRRLMS